MNADLLPLLAAEVDDALVEFFEYVGLVVVGGDAEGGGAHQHGVEDAPQTPHVAAHIVGLARKHLGRPVALCETRSHQKSKNTLFTPSL